MLLDTNPSITVDTPSCFIVEYNFVNTLVPEVYRMEMRPQYTGGPINIDIYRALLILC